MHQLGAFHHYTSWFCRISEFGSIKIMGICRSNFVRLLPKGRKNSHHFQSSQCYDFNIKQSFITSIVRCRTVQIIFSTRHELRLYRIIMNIINFLRKEFQSIDFLYIVSILPETILLIMTTSCPGGQEMFKHPIASAFTLVLF